MITDILPRKNFLLRPTVANIDLVVITISCSNPDFSFLITDKLLALAEIARIPDIICLTKVDIAPAGLVEMCSELYGKIGYKVFPVSAKAGIGIETLRSEVSEKLTVFAPRLPQQFQRVGLQPGNIAAADAQQPGGLQLGQGRLPCQPVPQQ